MNLQKDLVVSTKSLRYKNLVPKPLPASEEGAMMYFIQVHTVIQLLNTQLVYQEQLQNYSEFYNQLYLSTIN